MNRRLFVRIAALAVLSAAALRAPDASAQFPLTPRPTPILPAGQREPLPPGPGGAPPNVDPCQVFNNQPVVSLSLSPAEIYREDSITATWEVRDRRPGVQWGFPVQLVSSFGASPHFPDPVGRSGSHTFTTPSVQGRITLKTRCGEKHADFERISDGFLDAVEPARGAPRSNVTLRGSLFGERAGQTRVELIAGGQTRTMAIALWGGNTRIDAVVPDDAPPGPATIRVVKGGRRPTLARPFRVVKSLTVNNAVAGLALASLGIPAGFVHLDAGQGASSVALPGGLAAALGIPATFTLVAFEVNVPQGEKILQTVVAPMTGFPEKVYYDVQDVNSNGLSASVAGGQFVLALTFESAGPEIRGRVRYCDAGVFGACLSHSWKDSLAPDIQIDNVRVTLRLTPGVANGALTFPSGLGAIEADVQIGSDFANWIVPHLRTFTNNLKQGVVDVVTRRLNAQATRDALAAALTGRLQALDPTLHSVVAVTPNGNSILVEYE
ncbi:MAG: hypothetical protein ABI768_07735 [Acidobacteriota bacterium]